MRISDWSSDVCSSDLVRHEHQTLEARSRFAECDAVCRRVKGQHRFRAGAVVEADHLLAVGPGDGPQCPFAIEGKAADAQILVAAPLGKARSEEHTSELQSLMRNSYAVFCLTQKILQSKQQKMGQEDPVLTQPS